MKMILTNIHNIGRRIENLIEDQGEGEKEEIVKRMKDIGEIGIYKDSLQVDNEDRLRDTMIEMGRCSAMHAAVNTDLHFYIVSVWTIIKAVINPVRKRVLL